LPRGIDNLVRPTPFSATGDEIDNQVGRSASLVLHGLNSKVLYGWTYRRM
jgi:hypothetical protein